MKKIALVGGGTGGHIFPLLAIYKYFQRQEIKNQKPENIFIWVGEIDSLEQKIAQENEILFFSVRAGKLRRYFSLRTIFEPFFVLVGFFQSLSIFQKQKIDIVFSKGGYVSLPVAIAAWILRIPVYLHESDSIPGLANRLVAKFAKTVFLTFEEAGKYFPTKKIHVIGQILNPELFESETLGVTPVSQTGEAIPSPIIAKREAIYRHCEKEGNDDVAIQKNKPPIDPGMTSSLGQAHDFSSKTHLLVIGGSQGSTRILEFVLEHIDVFSQCRVSVVLGNLNQHFQKFFASYDFVTTYDFLTQYQLAEIYPTIDVAITRAGATVLFELAAFRIRMIMIPLPESANHHQYYNACILEKQGHILVQENDFARGAITRIQPLLSYKKEKSGVDRDFSIKPLKNIFEILTSDSRLTTPEKILH